MKPGRMGLELPAGTHNATGERTTRANFSVYSVPGASQHFASFTPSSQQLPEVVSIIPF